MTEKREKWTISPMTGGKVAVVSRLPNRREDDPEIILNTEEEAWELIDSGLVDNLCGNRHE